MKPVDIRLSNTVQKGTTRYIERLGYSVDDNYEKKKNAMHKTRNSLNTLVERILYPLRQRPLLILRGFNHPLHPRILLSSIAVFIRPLQIDLNCNN